jgi:hypothetical protein
MATLITFSAPAEVNGQEYVKGDKLSVSDSIHDRLKAEGKIEPEKKGK